MSKVVSVMLLVCVHERKSGVVQDLVSRLRHSAVQQLALSVLSGFGRSTLDIFRLRPAASLSSATYALVPSSTIISMLSEEGVGITQYATTSQPFSGILKHRQVRSLSLGPQDLTCR